MEVPVTKVFTATRNSTHLVVANQGGARSSKSHSTAQVLLEKFTNERDKDFLVIRKTMPALRVSAMKLLIRLLKEYNYYGQCRHNKSENTIQLGSNWLLFGSLFENSDRIKSTEFNYIWMEEANEFTWEDYNILKLRLSKPCRPGESNKLFLTYNPSDKQGWINQRLSKDDEVEFITSNYKDNPFLSDEYIKILEGLKDKDENYYKIYALGEYGVLGNYIYDPYILHSDDDWPRESYFHEVIYGLDFGFTNPTALLELGLRNQQVWMTQLLYESGLTNPELKEKMLDLIPERKRQNFIYADSAEPDRIEELRRAGFRIIPADKQIVPGIRTVRQFELHSRESNVELNAERSRYAWRKDRQGNVLEEPIKYDDHGQDAKRYAIFTHTKTKREREESRLIHTENLKFWNELPELIAHAIVVDSRLANKTADQMTSIGVLGLSKDKGLYVKIAGYKQMTFVEAVNWMENAALFLPKPVILGFDEHTYDKVLPQRLRKARRHKLEFQVKRVSKPRTGHTLISKLDAFISQGLVYLKGADGIVHPEQQELYDSMKLISTSQELGSDVMVDMLALGAELLLENKLRTVVRKVAIA